MEDSKTSVNRRSVVNICGLILPPLSDEKGEKVEEREAKHWEEWPL